MIVVWMFICVCVCVLFSNAFWTMPQSLAIRPNEVWGLLLSFNWLVKQTYEFSDYHPKYKNWLVDKFQRAYMTRLICFHVMVCGYLLAEISQHLGTKPVDLSPEPHRTLHNRWRGENVTQWGGGGRAELTNWKRIIIKVYEHKSEQLGIRNPSWKRG